MNLCINNIYIIQSPLQLLSAIEAANYYKEDKNILLIRYANEKLTNFQIKEILKLYSGWSSVFEILPNKFNLLTGLKTISLTKKLCSNFGKSGRIFLGDYRSWYAPYLLTGKLSNDCYLLDDGNSTIDIQNNYLSKSRLYFGGGLKGFVKNIVFSFWKLLVGNDESNVNIFTGFDLKPNCDRQKVICHSFEYLRLLSVDKSIDKASVYFFGAPISELSLLSRARELELLGNVNDLYKSSNINLIYIPHRRDSLQKIACIEGTLKIDVVKFAHCAEVELILSSVIPFGIASFYSTVLYTLPKIFNFELVESYKLPILEMPDYHRAGLAMVYAEYEKSMRVIDFSAH